MKVIGFNYDYFISSLCILDNDKILFASPEERFSREKNTKRFPYLAFKSFLNEKKISFNVKNEPIVNSPKDAIRTFYNSGLDKLIIGNFLIAK